MPIPYERALALFKQLGAQDAEVLAEAEADDPALVRFLFLKALWSNVISEDSSWMQDWGPHSKHPIPAAIQRMLAKGIDPDDLTDVVRDMQIDVLFNACVLLTDASHGIEDLQKNIPETIDWTLAEYDVANARPIRAARDLHGNFYDFDPSGRRGEPRKRRAAKKVKKKSVGAPKRLTRK